MTTNDAGTVNFWLDLRRNPGAFTDGVDYRWTDFVVNGQRCLVASEGRTLTATLNPGTDRAVEVFSSELDLDPSEPHMITVTWSSSDLALYADGETEYRLDLAELW